MADNECPHCRKAFCDRTSLRRHLTQKKVPCTPRAVAERSAQHAEYACPRCGKAFMTHAGQQKHVRASVCRPRKRKASSTSASLESGEADASRRAPPSPRVRGAQRPASTPEPPAWEQDPAGLLCLFMPVHGRGALTKQVVAREEGAYAVRPLGDALAAFARGAADELHWPSADAERWDRAPDGLRAAMLSLLDLHAGAGAGAGMDARADA